jgi:MEDS: MEthanogen/methylotroph, DcmR Sensory domain
MATEVPTVICWICDEVCELTDCAVDERGRAVHGKCHLQRLVTLRDFSFTKAARHQCVIYEGAPSRTLSDLADAAREKLSKNYRCFCLNSPPMIAGIKCCLAARGVDVAREVEKRSLVLTSERTHLLGGHFDIDRMIRDLEASLDQALSDGYQGLFATGDMSWEFGPQQDFAKVLEYEWRLEELFRNRPELSGICQYHRDTLPSEVMRQGLLSHPSIFINQTLSRVNPQYLFPSTEKQVPSNPSELDQIIYQLCRTVPQ